MFLWVQRLGESDSLVMKEVADGSLELREAAEGLDVKTGLCLVVVPVCHSGSRYSRDVCQQCLQHGSEPEPLSARSISM